MTGRRPGKRVAVIGAGVGGLAAALRLQAAGHRVTVFDSHDWPGGKMRTVPSSAGPVDAGPTVMTMKWVFDELLAEAGTSVEDEIGLADEALGIRGIDPNERVDIVLLRHVTGNGRGVAADAGVAHAAQGDLAVSGLSGSLRMADLLAPARRLLVAVGTIGPALEQRVEELQAGGEMLASYLLDSAGVVGLGRVGDRLRELAEQRGVPAHLIDGYEQIQREWLEGKESIGVTAGASAPEVLVSEVVARLRAAGSGLGSGSAMPRPV